MSEYTKEMAEALGVSIDLLPHVPELYRDLWNLGSNPPVIVDLLRPYACGSDSVRVFEPCCGKGAVSILLAKELGFAVHGIDLFPPFVQEAEAEAARAGLEGLCRFQIGDVREVVQNARGYDIVVFAAGGNVLGDLAATVGRLRQVVRSGGRIVIDGGYLKDLSRSDRPGWEYYCGHDETVQQLTSCGDALLREVMISEEELKSFNRMTTDAIRQRANDLAKRHPELAGLLAEYVQWEEEESEALERLTVWTVWLLKRP